MPLSLTSSTFHLTTPQKIEQIRQMYLDDSLIMNEAFADEQSRDSSTISNELTIESDRPCHGEIFETFESTLTNFEAEQACWPNYFQPPPPFCRLPLYPTSASAHCALIQRRINLYREVLAATAKYTEDVFKRDDGDLCAGVGDPCSEESGSSMPFAGQQPFRGDLAADLLGPFIELASSAQGAAAAAALRSIADLLARQPPLTLPVERAGWLPRLLDWLRTFLQARAEGESAPALADDSRGLAASAMLSLGLCSGSVLCILLTLEALLAHAGSEDGAAAPPSTDWGDMGAHVARLARCCSPPTQPL
eukprot:CAMPEP_0172166998 /NCGR_PEP_ID=MMETSP1050-20130122/9319_1 /TAXON_ID=233186 /ORGANISM="Cryptomonas curvata, Strain CCAP979/52" /LENGTH=306 /DNA_ID=CAMNT_0012837723 /DNA_START=110 /DNA_END=1027 /DNA_ORIENTATION=+